MATPKVRKQVYWWQDERADQPDMTAVQTYARLRSQDIVQFVANRAPRAGHTGRTWMPYSVWALNGSGITFEPAIGNRIRIAAGLRMVLTGGDGGDAGDVIELSEEVALNGSCPSVGTPLILLMARISTSLVAEDAADRVFFKTADQTEETRNVETTQRRDINWAVRDATDAAAITAAEGAGYSWVAELDYNGGAHQVSQWYYLLPESEVGGGALVESGMSFLWGLKRGLEAAYGGGKVWTDTPDNNLEDDELHAASLYALSKILVGSMDGSAAGTKVAVEPYTPTGGQGGSSYAWAAGVAYTPTTPHQILRWWKDAGQAGVANRKALAILAASAFGDITVGDAVDLLFGGNFQALRATKTAGGIRRIAFVDLDGSTEAMALQSNGTIALTTTYEVRIPLNLDAPDYNDNPANPANTPWNDVDEVWVAYATAPGSSYDYNFGWNLTQFNTLVGALGMTIAKRVTGASARVVTDASAGAAAVRMYLERAEVDPDGQGRTWASVGSGAGYVSWGAAGVAGDTWQSLSVDPTKLVDTVGHNEKIRVRIVPKNDTVATHAWLVSVSVTVETLLLPSG